MAQLSAWMGAGVVAAGVSAALIAGADTASADTGTGSSAGGETSATDSGDRDSPGGAAEGAAVSAGDTAGGGVAEDDGSEDGAADGDPAADDAAADDAEDAAAEEGEDATGDAAAEDAAAEEGEDATSGSSSDSTAGVAKDDDETTGTDVGAGSAVVEQGDGAPIDQDQVPEPAEGSAGDGVTPQSAEESTPAGDPQEGAAGATAGGAVAQRISMAVDPASAAVEPPARTLQDVLQSLVMEIIGAAVRFVSGPPVVPPGSDVTVRSSRLEITEGRFVRADWYYPDGEDPPQRLIYLQHGYLGIGPMYSYTAAWLAERTNSIVVAPTLSSNRYVREGFWLGDDQAHRATADLLLGDREALNASAIAAGLVKKYGAGAVLPDSFTMVGHSLGAGVAAGAAGYYADAVTAGGAQNHLAGIVLLDGAPPGNVLPDALVKLDSLGGYIPVLELGAPREDGVRRVDQALNADRPGLFNGVVLDNGQHLDAMQGGSWLIQLVSYLYRGFPTEQNKSAAQTLIAGWINDIFAGRIDAATGACESTGCAGIYGEPGAIVTVATPKGPATGVVIGSPAAPTSVQFTPATVTSLLSTRSKAVRLAVAG